MRQYSPLFLILLILVGCSSSNSRAKGAKVSVLSVVSSDIPGAPPVLVPKLADVKPPLKQADQPQALPIPEAKKYSLGSVFAKTVFNGVVKTSYVRLSLIDIAAPEKVYELYIGDKARQQNFPWEVQTVNPGYFFIDLPAGTYQFRSITIPVATTSATEAMDVVFDVVEGKTVYLGTLLIDGVGESVKLGGVPIIRPGFDYAAYILDEREEARKEWRQWFPEKSEEVLPRLMRVRLPGNKDIPLSR